MIRDLDANPFFVLGLRPECTRMEMERQGQLLLAMLEAGFAEASCYEAPSGSIDRTPEAVRAAMTALRDPDKRLRAELWARAQWPREASTEPRDLSSSPPGWEGAEQAMGWKR